MFMDTELWMEFKKAGQPETQTWFDPLRLHAEATEQLPSIVAHIVSLIIGSTSSQTNIELPTLFATPRPGTPNSYTQKVRVQFQLTQVPSITNPPF